jgi:hypothetical protein
LVSFLPCNFRVVNYEVNPGCGCKRQVPFCNHYRRTINAKDCVACNERVDDSISPKVIVDGVVAVQLLKKSDLFITSIRTGNEIVITGKAGDWFVTEPSGKQYMLTDADFRARFNYDSEPEAGR